MSSSSSARPLWTCGISRKDFFGPPGTNCESPSLARGEERQLAAPAFRTITEQHALDAVTPEHYLTIVARVSGGDYLKDQARAADLWI